MPQTYMVAVSPAVTGRTCRSAVSYSRSCGPLPGSTGTVGACHECIPSTLRCPVRPASDGRPDPGQKLIGKLGTAHQEVGQIRVASVVDQRRAVQPRGVQTRG